VAAASLALFQLPAGAEDIDLFVQPAGENGGVPNVLILLDNTANWEQPFTAEIAAITEAVDALEVLADDGEGVQFRLGLMMFTETGSPNNNIDGGYIRSAVRNLDEDYKAKFIDLLNGLHQVQDRSNGGKAGITMMEAYYYFAGQNPRSGNNKVKTDYTGNTDGDAETDAVHALPGNALSQRNGSRAAGPPYNSPVMDGSCGQNFIIYLSNGPAQDNSSDNTAARNGLQTEGGDTTTIPISPTGSMSSMADEWSRWMEQSPYAITTYTIDVNPGSTGQGPGWTALLKSMATVSRGKYFAVNAAGDGSQVALALKTIFSEIQSVNTVFASVALPVSVNTEGTYLNQIYIGMFRPDRDAFPRWVGNLKQYKLGITAGRLDTQDADSASAINSNTGFITECARSFWTPNVLDSYWSFRPQGACLTIAGSRNSNYPDGNVVEKGGQAYKLRAPTTQRSSFKTCSDATCTPPLVDFDTSNITAGELGVATDAERNELVTWARGLDMDDVDLLDGIDGDENINGVTASDTPPERRPSFHGDVVHSRPVAINMGTDAAPQVVVFYGGNDGVLRAVNGNRGEPNPSNLPDPQPIAGVGAGKEMWSFMAPEFYSHIKRLRDNTTPISFFGNTFEPPPTPLPKPYGFDGPITAYRNTSTDPDTLWLYAALRRGGRSIYAFDISTIDTSPANVTLKWRQGCPNMTDDIGCSGVITDIGQTWSAPVVMKAAGYSSGSAPLLIMGGGYDNCEDADPDTCGTTKGDRIFVLDGNDGSVVTSFPTTRGVVADVFVMRDDAGLAKWAYAVDMGGNIYRIGSGVDTNEEFGATDPATEWTMVKIASLGCSTAGGCSPGPTRKFMMPLDVVVDLDGTHVILAGSGDREKPLQGFASAFGVDNYFFRVNDRPWETEWLSDEQATCSTEVICIDSLLTIGATNPTGDELLAHPKGWRLVMGPGEQVVTSAITVFGTTTFSTHTPVDPSTTGGCTSNLGTARVYNISYDNAASRNDTLSRSEVVVGGGLPPSPVAGMVTLDDGTVMPFLIGGDPTSPLRGSEPEPSGLADQSKGVTYWYIHK
jgi:type IV pilus assembly protein PilY1